MTPSPSPVSSTPPPGAPRVKTMLGTAILMMALLGFLVMEPWNPGNVVMVPGPGGSATGSTEGEAATLSPTSLVIPVGTGSVVVDGDNATLIAIAHRRGYNISVTAPREIRLRVDGFRKLASPAVCYDEAECEYLGRTTTRVTPPACDRPSKTRRARDATDLLIPEFAVAKARGYAKTQIAEWLKGREAQGGFEELFPSAASRRLPFFPLYVFLRGLAGDRVVVNGTGNFTFESFEGGANVSTAPAHFHKLLTKLRTPNGYIHEFSLRYRMDLSHVPTPIYSNNFDLFDAMRVVAAETTATMGIDYLAYPVARDVLSGDWPVHSTNRSDTDANLRQVVDRRLVDTHLAKQEDGLPEWTRYAQATIAASQQLPRGQTCTTAKTFVVFLPGYGLGAALRLGSIWLGHAMLTKRLFVIHPTWKRWTGLRFPPTQNCSALGFSCYFIPPAPCVWDDINATGTPLVKNGAFLRRRQDRILIRGESRSPDLRLRDLPQLLPPEVTEEMVLAVTGLTVMQWSQRQLLRYLLRAMQPWAELVVLQEMYRAGFPWDAEDSLDSNVAPKYVQDLPESRSLGVPAPRHHLAIRPVIGTHYRNGDSLYNNEVAPILKCHQLDTSLTVAMVEETLATIHQLLHRNATPASLVALQHKGDKRVPPLCLPRYFFSFDHFRAVRHAEEWLEESKRRGLSRCVSAVGLRANVPVLDTNVSFRAGEDARTLMHRKFGGGYVIRVSLGNLFLATAVDGWVNNDASNWAMIINELRYTSGQMRHRALYMDLKRFAEESPRHLMQMFCNTVGPDTTWDREGWTSFKSELQAVFANRSCS